MTSVQVLNGRKLAEVGKRLERLPKVRKKTEKLKSRPPSSKQKRSKESQKTERFDAESTDAVEQSQESASMSDLSVKQKKRKHEEGVVLSGTPLHKKSKMSKKGTEKAELKRTEGTQDKRAHTKGSSSKQLELQAEDITAPAGDSVPRSRKKRKRETVGKREVDDYVSAVTTPQDHSVVALCDTGVETTRLETEHETDLPQTMPIKTKRSPLGKGLSSKSKKARSGVVAVEEIRPKTKRKKHGSLSGHVELLRTDIGTGQESTWM